VPPCSTVVAIHNAVLDIRGTGFEDAPNDASLQPLRIRYRNFPLIIGATMFPSLPLVGLHEQVCAGMLGWSAISCRYKGRGPLPMVF
jgi:hypothetical protein